MANPQLEDGYTRIANGLLEAIYSSDLNGTQFKIVLCVWRFTYGFQRKECKLSEAFISKAIDRHKKQVAPEIRKLISRGILKVVEDATFTTPRMLSFNKDFEEWVQRDGHPAELFTASEFTPSPASEFTPSPASEFTPSPASEFTPSPASEFTPQERKDLNKDLNKYLKKNTSCSEPDESAPSPSGILLPLNDKTFYNVPLENIKLWKDAYPAVDIEQDLKRMISWLESNPTQKKTRRGINKFINNWLARTQDSGGSKKASVTKNGIEEWINGRK